jgi:hypothetical protein
MARGKQKGVVSLKDTVPDSEIVRLGEIRNRPHYPFPDGLYGISGKYADFSLMCKRIAYRTGTEEDGVNCGKVIEYKMWEDYPCYISTLEGIFKAYAKILNLSEFKTKKMNGDIKELVEIHRKTQDTINKALSGIDKELNYYQEEICTLSDTKQRLLNDINDLKKIKEGIASKITDIDRMYEEIKDKRKIIVDVDKPKKHKIKEEEA